MGLDNRARAVPTPPLRSCGYWEEQRSVVTATARRPLSLKAPEHALSMLAAAFRARIGRKARKGCALPQVAGVGAQAARDCLSVRIYASELCPRQDSNLRSRLRRTLLCTSLTSRNMLAEILPGRISGAARRRSAAQASGRRFRLTLHDRHPSFGEARSPAVDMGATLSRRWPSGAVPNRVNYAQARRLAGAQICMLCT